MDTLEIVYIVVVLSIILVTSAFLIIRYIIIPTLKTRRITTFFFLKSAKVRFKVFDSYASHELLVSPKREYEVVYQLETEEGEVEITLDEQLEVSTTSRKSGSEIIQFSRYQPDVTFIGKEAKNGECSIKIYKRR